MTTGGATAVGCDTNDGGGGSGLGCRILLPMKLRARGDKISILLTKAYVPSVTAPSKVPMGRKAASGGTMGGFTSASVPHSSV